MPEAGRAPLKVGLSASPAMAAWPVGNRCPMIRGETGLNPRGDEPVAYPFAMQ